jgi:CBS domain-containing protein
MLRDTCHAHHTNACVLIVHLYCVGRLRRMPESQDLDVEDNMSSKPLKVKRVRRRNKGVLKMPQSKPRKFTRAVLSRMSASERSATARSITCGETMTQPHWIWDDSSMVEVIDSLTENNWDHIFVIDSEGAPQGRIHAVDVLKIIARKTVNRDIAWMHGIPAQQLVNQPPITVNESTPLLKAGALMLAHDLNQIGVVDAKGALIGVVGHNTMARKMPKFIL